MTEKEPPANLLLPLLCTRAGLPAGNHAAATRRLPSDPLVARRLIVVVTARAATARRSHSPFGPLRSTTASSIRALRPLPADATRVAVSVGALRCRGRFHWLAGQWAVAKPGLLRPVTSAATTTTDSSHFSMAMWTCGGRHRHSTAKHRGCDPFLALVRLHRVENKERHDACAALHIPSLQAYSRDLAPESHVKQSAVTSIADRS